MRTDHEAGGAARGAAGGVGGPARLEDPTTAASGLLERVLIRKREGWLVVRLAEVDWVGSAGNYVRLHLGGASHLYRHTLDGLEARLDARFVRVHRSTIVNLDRVAELRRESTGSYDIMLRCGRHLRLARRYRARVFAVMGSWYG